MLGTYIFEHHPISLTLLKTWTRLVFHCFIQYDKRSRKGSPPPKNLKYVRKTLTILRSWHSLWLSMVVVYVAPSPHDDDRGAINNVQYEKSQAKVGPKGRSQGLSLWSSYLGVMLLKECVGPIPAKWHVWQCSLSLKAISFYTYYYGPLEFWCITIILVNEISFWPTSIWAHIIICSNWFWTWCFLREQLFTFN